MNYEDVMNHLDFKQKQRISMAKSMVKGRPNERMWLEALEGLENTIETTRKNAREAFHEAFGIDKKI